MRIGVRTTRGILEYRSRDERPLTPVLPASPAAVRVYGADGCCTSLCLDLDVTRGGPDAVGRDAARLTAWLHARGARVVTDHSPSGGIHIYVPFAQRVPYDKAREIVEGLAAGHPTLDAGPHRSLKSGCIRPPGAAHKSGGYQQLVTPLATAYDVLRRRNAPAVLECIHNALQAEITAWHARQHTPSQPDPLPAASTPRSTLSARLRAIAETGVWDRNRYASASEARQAVIAGAVAAGWQLTDVTARVADGRWPGLAALYTRYSPTSRRTSLARDWHAARTYLATAQRASPGNGTSHARKSHTSPPSTHGGPPLIGAAHDDHDHVRTWRTLLRTVEVHRFPGRGGYLARFILRALGEAAHKTGSRYVAFGTRALAVATGADHSSVAAVLRRLAAQTDGWIDLIEPAHGEHADLYALTIPADLADIAADLRFDSGRAHALRPAFRELGHIPALVFEAIEAGRATSITTLVPTTGASRTAVSAAVDVLLAHGLVHRSPTGLTARPDRLNIVAEILGTLDAVAAQLRRHAHERHLWRVYLARHEVNPPASGPVEDDYWWPPDDADATLAGAVLAA